MALQHNLVLLTHVQDVIHYIIEGDKMADQKKRVKENFSISPCLQTVFAE